MHKILNQMARFFVYFCIEMLSIIAAERYLSIFLYYLITTLVIEPVSLQMLLKFVFLLIYSTFQRL